MVEKDKITVDKIEMNYARFGNGKKIFIILPGLSVRNVTDSASAVAGAYKSFTEEYTVYIFDRCENVSKGYSVMNMAEDTVRAMDELGIKNADFFGASQGGMIAMCIALIRPDLVNKTVLASTTPKVDDDLFSKVEEWINLAKKRDKKELQRRIAVDIFSKGFYEKFEDVFSFGSEAITENELDRFIIMAEALRGFNIAERLDKIKSPALVIGSEGDKLFGTEPSKFIAEKLGAELFVYDENYGHAVYDEARDFIKKVYTFLCG